MTRPESPTISNINLGPTSPLSPTKVIHHEQAISHPPSASVNDTTSISTTSELDRFREQWLKEVRKQHESIPATSTAGASTSGNTQPDDGPIATSTSPKSSKARARSPQTRRSVDLPPPLSTVPAVTAGVSSYPAVELTHSKTRSALAVYKQAVDAEAHGKLDDALLLYRQAFKLDTDIDRIYERSLLPPSQGGGKLPTLVVGIPHENRPRAGSKAGGTIPNPASMPFSVDPLIAATSKLAITPSVIPPYTKHSSLASILSDFPPEALYAPFTPEDESSPIPIELLPHELVVYVLGFLSLLGDWSSIESFASTCRKARILTLESSIWRNITFPLYVYPQIPDELDFGDVVEEMYEKDHRRALVEHPRVRYDGVYIAVCHYIRAGLSENAWVNITHLVTYHRYLRFFPDGTVLSLLANEDKDKPSEMVHLLSTSLRRNGFFIGTWSLVGTTVAVRDLIDPSGRNTRYGFEMMLNLKCKPVGRWNKLELTEYSTVRLESGETESLPLKHERPFWFSKVRSWKAVPDLESESE